MSKAKTFVKILLLWGTAYVLATLILGAARVSGQGSTPTRFNLASYNDLKQISTPSGNPNSGYVRIYAKTASTVCVKTYLGVETCFGGAGLYLPLTGGTMTGPVTFTQGTITTLQPFITHTATWNAGGVTFTNLFSNITDSASAAGSLLMDLQVGGSSKFKVGKDGAVTISGTGLTNLGCSATVPAAAGDIACVTGTPDTLQFHNGTSAVIFALSPRTVLMSYEGVCQAGANASFSFDTAAANAPAANCIIGTNVLARAVLDFDAAADESVYGSFWLPPDWTGAIDVDVEAQANEASTASARLGVQTGCTDDSEAYDAALNATQLWSWTGDGTANHRIIASKTGLTLTGCSAGDRFFFRFYRDADASGGGTDDLAADLRVVAVRFTTRRP